ncbi:MAG TPA: hypothetical protein VNU47_00870, partial [Candidatus Paceibacterota bacterium]|nr:hypothetical protein [Candidatus Paceibacterota bacterium]
MYWLFSSSGVSYSRQQKREETMNLLGKRRSKSLLFDILQEEPSLLQRIDQLQIQLKNRLKRRALEK